MRKLSGNGSGRDAQKLKGVCGSALGNSSAVSYGNTNCCMSWELDDVCCQCHLHVPIVSHHTNTQNYMTAVVLPGQVDSLLSCAGLSAPVLMALEAFIRHAAFLQCSCCSSSHIGTFADPDCAWLAVSLLTAFWEAITPVSIFWGAFLPLFLAWILYDRPYLSPIVVTLVLMSPFKFPPGYNVKLI